MPPRALLAVFAHPDDEAFGCGGTLARYAADGVRVVLVCATRGEVGEISDPALATPENLGSVREVELRNAAQALGLHGVRFLGYRDSGMAGTDDNANPEALHNANAEQVVAQLVMIIREVQPQVVITFDPHGGYGHPDHITIHTHTVAAFNAAGDPSRYPDIAPAWQPDRLFYSVFPRAMFRTMRDQMAAAGVDTSEWDQMEQTEMGWPDDEIHAVIDVSNTITAKWAAFNAHRTQFGPNNPFRQIPEERVMQMMRHEYFVQAWPQPERDLHLDDLFDGLPRS